jgi:hypothetical protein
VIGREGESVIGREGESEIGREGEPEVDPPWVASGRSWVVAGEPGMQFFWCSP